MDKKIVAFLIFVNLFASSMRHSKADSTDDFEKTSVFSLGLIGFVGHISPQEEMYRRIMKTSNAKSYFEEILESKEATIESKMYAMCGLREMDRQSFKKHKGEFPPSIKVSIMKGDLLLKENVSDVLYRISKFGCKTKENEP